MVSEFRSDDGHERLLSTSVFEFRSALCDFQSSMTIRIYTTSWCGDCRQAKRFLEEHKLLFEEIDIEEDLRAAKFVKVANNGKRKVPTFDVDGRVFSCSPINADDLKRELGL